MAAVGLSVVNLASDGLAFAIVGVSLYYVLKQKKSQYPYVKSLLAMVHVLFEGVILMEIWRNLNTSTWVIDWYTNIATSFILWDVVLLTLISYAVYVRPGGKGVLGRLRSFFVRWPHGLILAAFVAFILAAEVYLIGYHPYSPAAAPGLETLDGVFLPDTVFNSTFLNITLVTLAFFFAYPTAMLIRTTLQVKDPDVRRALLVLPFCWGGIGAELFVFNGYLVSLDFDVIAVGYVIAALVFGVAASIFRRATLLSTFFEPITAAAAAATTTAGPAPPVVERGEAHLLPGVPLLMEVDPSTSYETAVKKFAAEKAASGTLVYAFTAKGSPIYLSLESVVGVRFFTLTSKVSYPRPGEGPTELLVPENDTAVLLDLLDKTIASTGDSPVLFVFDSISSFILYIGFESTYKFIKQANEILDKPKVSSVYLATIGAHDERVLSLTKSLFRMHATYDAAGLRVTRGSGLVPAD